MMQVDPVVLPPDPEWLAQWFFTPILTPTPVATRLPKPDATADTVNGFLRVEAGGGTKFDVLTPNPLWNMTFLMHAYSPNEMQAASISQTATAHAAAAKGQTLAGSWYIVRVTHVVLSHRLTDPMVNLLRYRSMVTWCVQGVPAGS